MKPRLNVGRAGKAGAWRFSVRSWWESAFPGPRLCLWLDRLESLSRAAEDYHVLPLRYHFHFYRSLQGSKQKKLFYM